MATLKTKRATLRNILAAMLMIAWVYLTDDKTTEMSKYTITQVVAHLYVMLFGLLSVVFIVMVSSVISELVFRKRKQNED